MEQNHNIWLDLCLKKVQTFCQLWKNSRYILSKHVFAQFCFSMKFEYCKDVKDSLFTGKQNCQEQIATKNIVWLDQVHLKQDIKVIVQT